MTNEQSFISVCSYNSTGFGLGAQIFIEKLLSMNDILCLQEHFLTDCKDKRYSNTDKIREKFNADCDMHITPAVKDNSQISRGRASGGLATIWKRHLTKYVTQVPVRNPRIQVTKFQIQSSPVLLINCYFPCDPRSGEGDLEELVDLLSDIDNVIRGSDATNILLAGDLNCHFERMTRFTITIDNWLKDNILTPLWSITNNRIQEVDFTYCDTSKDPFAYSTIDHFAASQTMLCCL